MRSVSACLALVLFEAIIHFSCKGKPDSCSQLSSASYKTYEDVVLAIKRKTYEFQDSLPIWNGERLRFVRYYSCNRNVGYIVFSYIQKPEDYRCDVPMRVWEEFKKSDDKEVYFEKTLSKYLAGVTVIFPDSQKYEYHVCE